MAGVSSSHRQKIQRARRMMSRQERINKVSPFRCAQWRFRNYMIAVRTNPVLKERFESQKKLFSNMMKNAKKKISKKSAKGKNS